MGSGSENVWLVENFLQVCSCLKAEKVTPVTTTPDHKRQIKSCVMEPEVKKYFQKIISSFSMGLLWMFTIITAGLYFKLALVEKSFQWYNGLFYTFFLASLGLLIRYYYRIWRTADFTGNEG